MANLKFSKGDGQTGGANVNVTSDIARKGKQIACTLTDAERRLINNFDEGERGQSFGSHKVKSYTGDKAKYQFLNAMRLHYGLKNIGTISFIPREDFWYLDAIDGETYRIPESENGIDADFDIEFKRNNV